MPGASEICSGDFSRVPKGSVTRSDPFRPEIGSEGCLSFPEITGDIARVSRVTARALALDGSEIDFEATGLLTRALQHEVDHLNGILFIDRMNSAAKASLAGKLKRLQRASA